MKMDFYLGYSEAYVRREAGCAYQFDNHCGFSDICGLVGPHNLEARICQVFSIRYYSVWPFGCMVYSVIFNRFAD